MGTSSKRDNLALVFLAMVCNMYLFLGDNERKLNFRRRNGRETIFFSENANFHITDEQELIFSSSDSQGPPAFATTHLFGFRFDLSGNYVRPLIP